MAKTSQTSYSRYSREAVALLGLLIRNARLSKGCTLAEVAERAGVSRGLVQRIEAGEMGSSVGAAFEVAAIVGVKLFDAEPATLTPQLAAEREKQALLPNAARARATPVSDDF